MTWHRSDDGFPEHPKSDALAEHFGDDWATCAVAFMAWHHMGCDCAARRTDGVFSAPRAYRVVRAPRVVIDRALEGLLKVGFLDKHRDGFVFHDWAKYQPTRADLDAERAAKTERQQRWRKSLPGKAASVGGAVDASTPPLVDAPTPPLVDGGVDASVDGGVDASVDGGVDGAPSRPVPTHTLPTRESMGEGEGSLSPPRDPPAEPHGDALQGASPSAPARVADDMPTFEDFAQAAGAAAVRGGQGMTAAAVALAFRDVLVAAGLTTAADAASLGGFVGRRGVAALFPRRVRDGALTADELVAKDGARLRDVIAAWREEKTAPARPAPTPSPFDRPRINPADILTDMEALKALTPARLRRAQ